MLCACRMEAIEDIAYSGLKVSSHLEKCEREDMYFKMRCGGEGAEEVHGVSGGVQGGRE